MFNEKSCCDDCSNKKRCKECNIVKTKVYKYKNNKINSTCIECFNKKVKSEFCNKEFKKTYLTKQIKKYHIKIQNNIHNKIHTNETNNDEINNIEINNCDESNFIDKRTLIVVPSFCVKTHLLLNKLQLIRLCDSEKQIEIITRSPEQYEKLQLEDTKGQQSCISVEENFGEKYSRFSKIVLLSLMIC